MRTIPMTFFLMSLSGVWARSEVMHVQTVLGANCSLPCRAKIKQGVQYLFVSWYKMQLLGDPPTPKRRGLVTRDLPDGLVEHYLGQKRQVVLENSSNILLPNVTCGDHGSYICRLYAPIGERNLEGEVILQLSDHVEKAAAVPKDTVESNQCITRRVLRVRSWISNFVCLINRKYNAMQYRLK
ncbi:CD83 antigen isoform X3 [Vanacampus margaritifer]